MEAIEGLCFPASLPLAGTGRTEGGKKTQPFNRFHSRLFIVMWCNVAMQCSCIHKHLLLTATLARDVNPVCRDCTREVARTKRSTRISTWELSKTIQNRLQFKRLLFSPLMRQSGNKPFEFQVQDNLYVRFPSISTFPLLPQDPKAIFLSSAHASRVCSRQGAHHKLKAKGLKERPPPPCTKTWLYLESKGQNYCQLARPLNLGNLSLSHVAPVLFLLSLISVCPWDTLHICSCSVISWGITEYKKRKINHVDVRQIGVNSSLVSVPFRLNTR